MKKTENEKKIINCPNCNNTAIIYCVDCQGHKKQDLNRLTRWEMFEVTINVLLYLGVCIASVVFSIISLNKNRKEGGFGLWWLLFFAPTLILLFVWEQRIAKLKRKLKGCDCKCQYHVK